MATFKMTPEEEAAMWDTPVAEVKVRRAIVEYLDTLGIDYYRGGVNFHLQNNGIYVELGSREIEKIVGGNK